MRWPGRLPAGHVEGRAVISLDIFATALAAADADLPETAAQRDGVNLLPHVTSGDARPVHESLYWRVGANAALRQGDWKIVRQGPGRRMPAAWQLYNLADDVGEAKDLASQHPEVVERLTAKWSELDAAMAAP
jgi:arylsulfatase A-like enzyme